MDIRNIDPRAPGTLDMRIMDARDQMQGNLRGVTGRLNGATSEMWQQSGMPGMPGINKTVGPNAGAAAAGNNPQWPNMQGPKDLEINKPSGWDSSPPAARRPIGGTNFDDGTSLWGQSRVPGVQDPMARNNFGRNPIGGGAAPTGIPQNRLPGAGMKPGEGMKNTVKVQYLFYLNDQFIAFQPIHGDHYIQEQAIEILGMIRIHQIGKIRVLTLVPEESEHHGMRVQMQQVHYGIRASHHGLIVVTLIVTGHNKIN